MKKYNLFENWTEIRQLRLLGYSIPWMYECSSNGLVLTRGLIVKTEPDLSLTLVGQKGNKTKTSKPDRQYNRWRDFNNRRKPGQITITGVDT